MKNYDESNKDSIYEYANKLKNLSFKDILNNRIDYENSLTNENNIYKDKKYIENYSNKLRKGGLGDFLEKVYFDIDNNSEQRPDFYKAGVELKLTPFKKLKNGKISSKERLVISMINYHKIVEDEFFSSNLWEKIENILMVFYLWEKSCNKLDYKIYFIHMYNPPKDDLKIIKEDFYKIRQKVLDGKAHELSESDTIYVGACTKANNSSVKTSQPFSNELAKPRAFSFKNSYMTYILNTYVANNEKSLDKIIDNNKFTSFEDLVLEKISKYLKKNVEDLFEKFNIKSKSKQKYSMLVLRILGVNTDKAEEFEKANIEIKTIKHKIGKKPKESMSFPKYIIKDLVNTDWHDSSLYKLFSSRKFLFVEFVEKDNKCFLESAKFWNMPYKDLEGDLKKEWLMFKEKFQKGVNFTIDEKKGLIRNDLPKSKDTRIIHSRPHSSKASYYFKDKDLVIGNLKRDADLLPNGDMMTYQSFWLNSSYIYEEIRNKT